MMKTILFLMTLGTFVVGKNLNAQNCTAFKEGRFIYKEVTGAVSVRKDGKQISYYADSSYTEYDVAWQDSCNFTLTFFTHNLFFSGLYNKSLDPLTLP